MTPPDIAYRPAPKRWALILLAVLGAGLIAAPAVFQMFHRAPLGAQMIKEFKPYMTSARLNGYQRDLREIDAGVREGSAKVPAALYGPGSAAQRKFDARFPDFASFRQQWGPIDADMTDLLNRIQGNLGNYQAVAALPSFKLFPWFFVIPGVLVLLALGIAAARRSTWGAVRWVLVALGVGLVLAPAVFQMFSRAPKGGHMMTAFKTIETRHKVETIQGYFGSIAVGQGSVRLDIIPALEKQGLSRAQIAASFPAVSTFDRRWVPILGDLTPMIGTMSDNVDNYQAVAALPPFPLFPWFFVIPGLMIVAAALAASPTRRRSMARLASVRAGAGILAVAAVPLALAGSAPRASASAAAHAAAGKALVGTFKLAPGRYAHGRASGSYFRMIFPGGGRKYFKNPDSAAGDKTFTLLRPGTSGGLVTGRFQRNPSPPFDRSGNSLAAAIIRPQKFAGIYFGLATLPKDPQSGKTVPAPSVRASGRTLAGFLQALTAEWNKQYFNQGAPKPGAARPTASGSYNARTGAFVLQWTSLIKGGAFNGFTGFWHLQGTFRPARASAAAAAVRHKRRCRHTVVRHHRRVCRHVKKHTRKPAPAPAPSNGAARALTGTFKLATGTYSRPAGAGGTYFRMVFPGGSVDKGPYFSNPSSSAADPTYTLLTAGTDGGLISGSYQDWNQPAFNGDGDALPNRIIQPQRFAGRNFSIVTAPRDPQTQLNVPVPSISVTDGRLSGQLQAWAAGWNKLWFNQGSPKPGGSSPGRTTPVGGTYDESTRAFVLTWASTIVGGPFNGFTGFWHLAGTFEPAATKPAPTAPGGLPIPPLPK
jgi:hypothetical protein